DRPGQLHAYILRSPHAHARLGAIDASAALKEPGVVAVFTGQDMAKDEIGGLPCGWLINSKDGSPMVEPPHPPLIADRVRHVGDQGAVVSAETRDQAKSAAELLSIDYEDLPAIISTGDAIKAGAPQVWEQ